MTCAAEGSAYRIIAFGRDDRDRSEDKMTSVANVRGGRATTPLVLGAIVAGGAIGWAYWARREPALAERTRRRLAEGGPA
jgi:hypothetical protein